MDSYMNPDASLFYDQTQADMNHDDFKKIKATGDRDEEETSWGSWKKKVLDLQEAKNQALFSLPMILVNVVYYAITTVSLISAGHLGKLELAAATLANSWAFFTGFAFMTGLSGALETLCGQAFGARLYRMLGIYLQASCVISLFFSIIISIIWFHTKPILIFFQQDPIIAKQAALYMRYLIPGIFAYGILQNLLRFLQTQSIVKPLALFSALTMGIHIGVVYALVYKTSLGFRGAPLAASISFWISTLLLAIYVLCAKKFEQTWKGFTFESFSFILTCLKLGLPSAAMLCLVFEAFDVLVFLSGLMPNPEVTTSLIAMCVNIGGLVCMIALGLSASASTRVSNELGAGNVSRAKHAMAVTLELAGILVLVIVLAFTFGQNMWAGFFTSSSEIIKGFVTMKYLLIVSIILDFMQSVLSGVLRGCGLQNLAVWANLSALYLIGLPFSILLGFKMKLYAMGLWIGLICGLFSQVISLLLIILCKSWTKLDFLINISENGTPNII